MGLDEASRADPVIPAHTPLRRRAVFVVDHWPGAELGSTNLSSALDRSFSAGHAAKNNEETYRSTTRLADMRVFPRNPLSRGLMFFCFLFCTKTRATIEACDSGPQYKGRLYINSNSKRFLYLCLDW